MVRRKRAQTAQLHFFWMHMKETFWKPMGRDWINQQTQFGETWCQSYKQKVKQPIIIVNFQCPKTHIFAVKEILK